MKWLKRKSGPPFKTSSAETGLSLLTAMLGVAAVGFTSVVMVRIMDNTTLSATASNQKVGWPLLQQQVLEVLSHPRACLATFQRLNLTNNNWQDIKVIYPAAGGVNRIAFATGGRYDGLSIDLRAIPGLRGPTGSFRPTLNLRATKKLRIRGEVTRSRTLSTQMSFDLIADSSGNVVDCIAAQPGTIRMLPQERSHIYRTIPSADWEGAFSGKLPNLPSGATHALIRWSLDVNNTTTVNCDCKAEMRLAGDATTVTNVPIVGAVSTSNSGSLEGQVGGFELIKLDQSSGSSGQIHYKITGSDRSTGQTVDDSYIQTKVGLWILGYMF